MKTDKLVNLAISDNGFVFDPSTGHSFTTDAVGLDILNLLKQGKDVGEITETLLNEYAVSENELEADILDFIHSLKNFDLVSE